MDSTTGPVTKDVRLGRIAMVILYVRDPMASLAFYRDLLGMKVLEASPHWAELDGGGVHLALHPHPSIPADRGSAYPWIVFQVEDVHGTYEALRAKGIASLTAPKEVCSDERSVGLSVDVKDPDGNLLSFFAMVPREQVR